MNQLPEKVSDAVQLQGSRLFLTPLRERDVSDRYVHWMNEPKINRFLESRFVRHSKESIAAFVAAMEKNPDVLFLAIRLKEDGQHIGNIKLGPINWPHRHGDIGILIGEEKCWGRGHAFEAITLLAGYAKDQLKLHKLTAGCYENNLGSRKAFEKAGFEVEGIRKKHCLCEGTWVDVLLLGRILD